MFHCEGFLIAASHCKALDDASAGDSDVELPPDVDDDRPSGLTSHCNCKLSCHAKFDEASVEVFRSEQLKDLTRRQQETFNKVKRFVDELPDKTSRIAWAIGGQKVCRPFWEHYHAVGHSVMDEWVKLAKNGHAALPEKGARLPRSKPKTDEVDVWFLQIYQGLAEPTPMERDDGGYQHVEELPDLANQHEVVNDINHPLYALSVGLGSDGHTVPKRYLNQSDVDVNSLWHAYETQHLDQAHVSRDTFRKAFQRNWKKFLLFKGGVRCNVCADFDESRKHCLTKLERQEIDAQKQRHVDRCDADRSVNVRGNRLSALESTYTPQHASSSAIKILIDGMDQAKYRCPRNLSASATFSACSRPALHMTGCVALGVCEAYYILLPDCKKDSNMNATCISDMLDKVICALSARGPDTCLPRHLVIGADNTPRESKNKFFATYCSFLVCRGHFDSVQLEFMQPGHTKNELDQRFSSLSTILQRAPTLETPQQFAEFLKDGATPLHAQELHVQVLNSTHDFQAWFEKWEVQMSGLTSTHLEPDVNHVWRFQLRRTIDAHAIVECNNPKWADLPQDGEDVVLTVKRRDMQNRQVAFNFEM